MGTPIPPEFEPPPSDSGNACSNCWGAGKPFGNGDTPELITVIISGVNKSAAWVAADGEPINGEFVLIQSGALPCVYEYDIDFVSLGLLFHADYTDLQTSNPQGRQPFVSQSDDPCEVDLINETVAHFTGGTAIIYVPEVV